MCGKNKEICCNVFGWIFQLSTWTFLIVSLVIPETFFFVIFGLVYLIYIILEFCSPTSRYLCNKNSSQGIYEQMSKYFKTLPVINWTCECYHYETRTYTTTDSDGNVSTHTTTEKVVTCRGSQDMSYYSSRDVSGIFLLNCDEANINKKQYIKLELTDQIDFADSATVTDYQIQKQAFISAYQNRDVHFDYWENRYIPGLIQYNLINIHNEEKGCINFGLFFLFTILSFAELYKLYIDSKCIHQDFTIKKIISTRYNLNGPQLAIKYQKTIPSIDLIYTQYYFKPSEYNYSKSGNNQDLPSKEEVENANKNRNKLPKIQSINEIKENEQNNNAVIIHNKTGKSSQREERDLPPAIPFNEVEKSTERLNEDKKLDINIEVKQNEAIKENEEIKENDSVIFVNKQINIDNIDNNKQ